jgi:UDP-glucose 4-epimerase
LIVGDLRDPRAIDAAFDAHRIDAVMHFAGKIVVSESTRDPALYYEHNVNGTVNLLQAMLRHDSPPLVFSSTAAVDGDPQYTPIDEAHPCLPVNPYGWSKYIIEQTLIDFRRAYGLRSASLRYFNAAGASSSGLIGERHDPEAHLIPHVLRRVSRRIRLRCSAMIIQRWMEHASGTTCTFRTYVVLISLQSNICEQAAIPRQ